MSNRHATLTPITITQTPATTRSITSYWQWLALGTIVLGAAVLRVLALHHMLPFVDHPDEPNPINYVVTMLQTGDPNPHFFQKPSLYVYLLLSLLSLHYRLGLANGLYGDISQMQVTTYIVTTIPGFFYWARAFTAGIGVLTVLNVFLFVRRVWGDSAALIGALFLAVLPFHIQFSNLVTTDVASAWLVLLCVSMAVAVAQAGHWSAYLVAGVFSGLAASTKYNAGVVALTIIVAHWLYWGHGGLRQLPRLVAAGAASIAAFLIGTPYALLAWPEFIGGITGQWGAYNNGVGGHYSGAWNVAAYADFFWSWGMNPLACVAVLAGLVVLLRRQPKTAVVWLSFAVPTLLLHLSAQTHFMQNMLPLLVLCSLPIGVVSAEFIRWTRQGQPRLGIAAAVVLLAALVTPSAIGATSYLSRELTGDTRVQLLDWIADTVPPGARIAAELPLLPGASESRWTAVHWLPEHDMAWYRAQGYSYVVASSNTWRQWEIPNDYLEFSAEPPVMLFGGANPQVMTGPHLAVYATGLAPADVLDKPADTITIGGAQLLGVGIGEPIGDALQHSVGLNQTRTFKPGDVLGLRTFWQVEQRFTSDYLIFVHVRNAAGETVAQRDAAPWQGGVPTSTWQPGSLVVDVNDLVLPPTMPPGEYTLNIGMFDPATSTHPPMLVNGEQQSTDAVEFGAITVR